MNKLSLTPEQVESLRPYAAILTRAARGGEVIGLQAHVSRTVLWPIYKAIYKATPGNEYCNACVVKVCSKLGALYLEAEHAAPAATEAPEAAQQPTDGEKAPQKAKNEPSRPSKKTNRKNK